MKYENASDLIPEELLREIQKYAAGKLLYIPSGDEKRAWGEASGYRDQLQRRNRMIQNKYAHGLTVSELADEYFLSLDSIKKIIYLKKYNNGHVTYAPTIDSAVQYANLGILEEWIQCYLQLTRKAESNLREFGKDHLYFGVVKFPLRLIRMDGIKGDQFQSEEDSGQTSAGLPLLIQYEQGNFYCTEQKEILVVLKQRKVNAYPTIIVLKESADYKHFMKFYGTVLFFVGKA
ncbi:CD3324 family protein [Paenibacillus albus]|uniref:CD3324 family protein n=1 Tax=Paenibacillus albus TaxID=2495582 RepID=UPI0015B1DBB5|nr:CD3324 family protein [Paenibacillus albus]